MAKLILATTSPHRKRLFSKLGIEFTCEGSDIDEHTDNRPKEPIELVVYLSRLKSEAVAKNHSSGIIVGFDTIGYFENQIFEKPKSKKEAFDRLKILSNGMHFLLTGIYMINLDNRKKLSNVDETRIYFRKLKDKEIERYLNENPQFDRTMGYNPEKGYSSTFVERIEGSPCNFFFGLPLEKIIPMLFKIGYELK